MALVLVSASACRHFSTDVVSGTEGVGRVQPAREAEASPPPDWATSDCQVVGGRYQIPAHGEGRSTAEAVNAAKLNARQSALICIFGAVYTIDLSVKEGNKGVAVDSNVRANMTADSVDWSGFSAAQGKIKYLNSEKTDLWVMYEWEKKSADAARARFLKLQENFEKERALKEELEAKKVLIKRQEENLARLQEEDLKLKVISEKIDSATSRRMEHGQRIKERSGKLRSYFLSIKCGITFPDIINDIGEPDEYINNYKNHSYLLIRYEKFHVWKLKGEVKALKITDSASWYGHINDLCGS